MTNQIYVAMVVQFAAVTSEVSLQDRLEFVGKSQLLQLSIVKRNELKAFFKPSEKMSKIKKYYPLAAMIG